jgi:hypothetical protein
MNKFRPILARIRPHTDMMFAWSPGGMVLAVLFIMGWNMLIHPGQTFITNLISSLVGILFYQAVAWSYRRLVNRATPATQPENPATPAPPKEKTQEFDPFKL